MGKDVLCSICLSRGKVSITKPEDDAYFKCPNCKCGVWPPEDDPDMVKRMRQHNENNKEYRSCSLPEGVHPHGGGDGTGKPKTEAMKKKPLSRIKFEMDSPRVY